MQDATYFLDVFVQNEDLFSIKCFRNRALLLAERVGQMVNYKKVPTTFDWNGTYWHVVYIV